MTVAYNTGYPQYYNQPMSSPPLPQNRNSNNSSAIGAAVGAGVGTAVVLGVSAFFCKDKLEKGNALSAILLTPITAIGAAIGGWIGSKMGSESSVAVVAMPMGGLPAAGVYMAMNASQNPNVGGNLNIVR